MNFQLFPLLHFLVTPSSLAFAPVMANKTTRGLRAKFAGKGLPYCSF